jgi:hypothetical protein
VTRHGSDAPARPPLDPRQSAPRRFADTLLRYFTPAVTAIVNVKDGSYSLVPELLYSGITNLELRLRVALTQGDTFTEYGEKAVGTRVELRVRFFF